MINSNRPYYITSTVVAAVLVSITSFWGGITYQKRHGVVATGTINTQGGINDGALGAALTVVWDSVSLVRFRA